MRNRVLYIHPGFHKTGTSTIQHFLMENGPVLWPQFAVITPLKTTPLLRPVLSAYFDNSTADMAQVLTQALIHLFDAHNFGKRDIVVSDENLLGYMPGRFGQYSNNIRTDALKIIIDAAKAYFNDELDIHIHVTTRSHQNWLKSIYKHLLFHTKLTKTFENFMAAFKNEQIQQQTIERIKNQWPNAILTHSDLGTQHPLGPAGHFTDVLPLKHNRRQALQQVAPQNTGPHDDMIPELLRINHSDLPKSARNSAKHNLLKRSPQ